MGVATALEMVERVRTAFPGFYDNGRAMAHVYVDEGVEAGNVLMKQFDPQAEAISDLTAKLDELALHAANESTAFVLAEAEAQAASANRAYEASEVAGAVLGAQHIDQVRPATGASIEAVLRIERAITEINAISGSIATAVEQQGAATAEIARNVSQTASVANNMSDRTRDVSTEAIETDRYAVDVRTGTVALGQAVIELRHSVIRVVRTSTAEVNRRQSPQYEVDLSARLSVAGHGDYSVRISDLSEGGASIRGGPELSIGTVCVLRLEGVAIPLPCAVRGIGDGGEMHLAFELTAEAAAVLLFTVERLASDLAVRSNVRTG
jgi:methyl-accepting chemotaxis protein